MDPTDTNPVDRDWWNPAIVSISNTMDCRCLYSSKDPYLRTSPGGVKSTSVHGSNRSKSTPRIALWRSSIDNKRLGIFDDDSDEDAVPSTTPNLDLSLANCCGLDPFVWLSRVPRRSFADASNIGGGFPSICRFSFLGVS